MATIILTGGGTAGHCTPHLAILPYLKNDFNKIYYIGSENGIEKNIIKKANIPYYSVPCVKLVRSFTINNLKIPFKLVKGVLKAGKLIDQLKPDVIFSKGGYVSVPTVIAAKKRKIPVIAHESDLTVGLANKISEKYCEKILTSFPETAISLKKGLYVGSPIRKSFFSVNKSEALKYFGFNGKKPILLITGGSLGAQALNQSIHEILDVLLPKYDVIHICGKGNITTYNKCNAYYQTEYLSDIEKAFAIASVCVTRAGSNTLFELMCLKVPSVIIPLPKTVSRGDQIINADYFFKKGLAYVLPQQSLTSESLLFAINSVYSNRFNLIQSFEKYNFTDASREISRIIADYVY